MTRLVRRPSAPGEITWDPAQGTLDARRLAGVDGVVHLAGENVGVRWTEARKARIRESRIRGTRLLSDALASLEQPPSVFVSASAVGIYGNRGDEVLTETSQPGDPRQDFLVAVCLDWEAAADSARATGIRVVHPRFSVVLSPHGGALRKLLPPFELGLGGRLGRGAQWMSWISIDDAVAAISHILSSALQGPVNVTAPEPVTNNDFTHTLGRVLRRPVLIGLPAALLRLGLGEMAQSTLLASARAVPEKLLHSGFRFQHPRLEGALRQMLVDEPRSRFPV